MSTIRHKRLAKNIGKSRSLKETMRYTAEKQVPFEFYRISGSYIQILYKIFKHHKSLKGWTLRGNKWNTDKRTRTLFFFKLEKQ